MNELDICSRRFISDFTKIYSLSFRTQFREILYISLRQLSELSVVSFIRRSVWRRTRYLRDLLCIRLSEFSTWNSDVRLFHLKACKDLLSKDLLFCLHKLPYFCIFIKLLIEFFSTSSDWIDSSLSQIWGVGWSLRWRQFLN